MIRMSRNKSAGFSLVELVLATAILLIGVVAVVLLVPGAMQSNYRNRYDSTSVVMAEKLLDQMITQPLSATTFTDLDGHVISLGGAAGLQGNPLVTINNTARVDFSVPAVANYNFFYTDPNDASRVPYEVRWSVITTMQGVNVASKRYLVGVQRRQPSSVMYPVTLEAWVQQ